MLLLSLETWWEIPQEGVGVKERDGVGALSEDVVVVLDGVGACWVCCTAWELIRG
jgi:hypothetical protein